jgi:hypothetical protein
MYQWVDWTIGLVDTGGSFIINGRLVLRSESLDDDQPYPVVKYSVDGEEKVFKFSTNEFVDFFQKAPMALHWLSGTGHVLWANDVEMEQLGYTSPEYIGHHISEVGTFSSFLFLTGGTLRNLLCC